MTFASTFDNLRVLPGSSCDLALYPTGPDEQQVLAKKEIKARFHDELKAAIRERQRVLYASGTRAILFVFQAMDAGGKDSCIRKVFGEVDPGKCWIADFKVPCRHERARDFLWRVHKEVPPKGYIGVFNRSHYEDVLVPRVKGEITREESYRRMQHINNFESLLVDSGTAIVKFFLHISKDEQLQRLQKRLRRPDKFWKFDEADFIARRDWDTYMHMYEEILEQCSSEQAPWFVIPADAKWYRNYVVATIVLEAMKALDVSYPSLPEEALKYVEEGLA